MNFQVLIKWEWVFISRHMALHRLGHSPFSFPLLSVFCMSLQMSNFDSFENIKNHFDNFQLLHNFVSILGNQGEKDLIISFVFSSLYVR